MALPLAAILLFALGDWVAALCCLGSEACLVGVHVRAARVAGYQLTSCFASLPGLLIFSYLLFRSHWLYRHSGVAWKGRTYHVKDANGREISHT